MNPAKWTHISRLLVSDTALLSPILAFHYFQRCPNDVQYRYTYFLRVFFTAELISELIIPTVLAMKFNLSTSCSMRWKYKLTRSRSHKVIQWNLVYRNPRYPNPPLSKLRLASFEFLLSEPWREICMYFRNSTSSCISLRGQSSFYRLLITKIPIFINSKRRAAILTYGQIENSLCINNAECFVASL